MTLALAALLVALLALAVYYAATRALPPPAAEAAGAPGGGLACTTNSDCPSPAVCLTAAGRCGDPGLPPLVAAATAAAAPFEAARAALRAQVGSGTDGALYQALAAAASAAEAGGKGGVAAAAASAALAVLATDLEGAAEGGLAAVDRFWLAPAAPPASCGAPATVDPGTCGFLPALTLLAAPDSSGAVAALKAGPVIVQALGGAAAQLPGLAGQAAPQLQTALQGATGIIGALTRAAPSFSPVPANWGAALGAANSAAAAFAAAASGLGASAAAVAAAGAALLAHYSAP